MVPCSLKFTISLYAVVGGYMRVVCAYVSGMWPFQRGRPCGSVAVFGVKIQWRWVWKAKYVKILHDFACRRERI